MGPFDRFNDRAKRVLALAQDEAIRFNHNYIGVEHLLLGLAREGEGVAARALDALGVDLSKLRAHVEKTIGRGTSGTPSEITLSPRTKRVIEFAIDEARTLGHSHVGTEHLLLGIVRDAKSIATEALESLGVSLEQLHENVIATLGTQPTRTVTARWREYGVSAKTASEVLNAAAANGPRLTREGLVEQLEAELADKSPPARNPAELPPHELAAHRADRGRRSLEPGADHLLHLPRQQGVRRHRHVGQHVGDCHRARRAGAA